MSKRKMVSESVKILKKTNKNIWSRKLCFFIVLFIELFAFMTIITTSGFFLTGIQEKLIDAVELINADPSKLNDAPTQDSIESMLDNYPELETIFEGVKSDFINMGLLVFMMLFLSQLLTYFILRKPHIKAKYYFVQFPLVFILFSALLYLISFIYIKIQYFITTSPLEIIPMGLINILLILLLIAVDFLALHMLIFTGTKHYFKALLKQSKKWKTYLLFYIAFIILCYIIIKLSSLAFLLNPIIFTTLSVILLVCAYIYYRSSLSVVMLS